MRLKLILGFMVVLLAAAGGWLAWALLTPFGAFPAEGITVNIPRGTSRRAVARLLEQNGVVRSAVAFEVLSRLRSGVELQAGEYRFEAPTAATEVFRKIAEGRVFVHPLVIPEGLNIFEVARRVEQAGLASREEFLAVARDPVLIRDLAPKARTLEGFLFPATYGFPRNVTANEIAAAMVARFRESWSALAAGNGQADRLSPFEAVTLASLVEKETGVPGERPLIAGIFHNRLEKGIALQCDPTVLYAMELAGKNDGIINQSDLRLDSPYNTYRHRGLPPGPIANPGQEALRAALFPPETEYLYFVADTKGGHFFSRTIREHLANVARYRQLSAEAAKGNGQRRAPAPQSPRGAP